MVFTKLKRAIGNILTRWLSKEARQSSTPFCDYERLCHEIRPGDVILVEGRSRVSQVIKQITQSPWTHSALYIGRLYDIRDEDMRQLVKRTTTVGPNDQLILEADMSSGTIVRPIDAYQHDHMRICRARGLSPADTEQVINHALGQLGTDYHVRQILDLARFFFPWGILPRRWRSSLFEHNSGEPTRTVCSTLLAEAFASVRFPILPFVERQADGSRKLIRRNAKLFTPKDFDYSPYFDIIKYPFLHTDDTAMYRRLPWGDDELQHNDDRVYEQTGEHPSHSAAAEDPSLFDTERVLNIHEQGDDAEDDDID